MRRRSEKGESRAPLPPGFGSIWTTVAIDLVGFGIVLPILPRYAEDFGASPAVIGLLVASFSIAQLLFAPIWGRVSDRVGRKPVLIVSLVGTAVGSLLTGVAGSLWVLFAGRIIDGASGASVSVAQAAVADVAPPAERPRLLGLLGAAFGVGFVVGPALGGLASLGGPHVPFLIAAGIAAVNALVALRRLPETHTPAAPRPDAVPSPWRQPRSVMQLITVAFIGLVAFSGFEATFALLGEDRLGLSLASTGAVFAVIGLGLVIVQAGLVGPVFERLGEGTMLRAGLSLNAIGLFVLAVDGGWLLLILSLTFLVLGQGLLTPTLSSAVAGRVDDQNRGTALGLQQSAGGLARVIGPLLAGVLFEHAGVPAPYVVGGVLAVLALLLVPVGKDRTEVVAGVPDGLP